MLTRAHEPLPDPGRLFGDLHLAGRTTVVAAVSGGGDSLALLLLFQAYLARLAAPPALVAVTVDHRLRPGSGAEAEAVARLCAARGIAHRTVAWRARRPASGLQAAARAARHALLAEAAGAAGTDLVLTGHTADDQAETVAMRAGRGGGRGMAGIAPATLYDGRVWFVRPLLGTRRVALRRVLQAHGVAWHDDPSNRDPAFERARLRAALDEPAIAARLTEARQAAAARRGLNRSAAALIDAAAARVAPGLLRVDPAALAGEAETAVHALRLLLAVAGGRDQLADLARTRALAARLAAGPCRATLSRALVVRRREGVFLLREARGLPAVPLGADPVVWDGRYRIARREAEIPPAGGDAATIAALGRVPVPAAAIGDGAPAALARAAMAAEPALWRGGVCLGPTAGRAAVACTPVTGPWVRHLPAFDLGPAAALARLVGAPEPPASPWRGHIEPLA
ncbi:tRNA lysidine(34) synthetase TilS [Aquibium sp. A9E412]|uniref:tRNA lysidine(34) synthetase TilS n=1 Tax=Aquibium sp. A9E412 TaxID=2976767 RepID=UPI0025B0DCFC|nr:tRNA lysidine(34) synthetase TilS [Aquibium sp. A9E412]MDN2565350.1 tRNA lysidine(34) synthetase TilS [Aquibium sp. A9E412]